MQDFICTKFQKIKTNLQLQKAGQWLPGAEGGGRGWIVKGYEEAVRDGNVL